jgi:YidC/Oxa1 family membrane protein insertase
MLKNKWVLIGISVAALVAYDFFVLKPYNQKYQAQVKAQKDLEKSNIESPSVVVSKENVQAQAVTSKAPSTPQNKSTGLNGEIKPWEQLSSDKATVLELSGQRKVTIFSDGRIGSAVFGEYFVRESAQKENVKIATKGLRWSSSDLAIQDCLNVLAASASEKGAVFSAQTQFGDCKIEMATSGETGVVENTLVLNGFAQSSGQVFLSTVENPETGLSQDHHFLTTSIGESVSFIKGDSLFEEATTEGKLDWIVWGDRYFGVSMIPVGDWNPTVFHRAREISGKKNAEFGFRYPVRLENGIASYQTQLFFSTRDPETLDAAKPGLSKAVELGFFGTIANLLMIALRNINVLFKNWGVSIVVLTLLVRLMFWPLNKKVFASSQRMKEIQPEIEKIKNKFGNDKSKAQQMQVEIWGVYKKNNVNPLGSCLPLLLQMPIFLALYGALNHSIDLYQAPFVFWLSDLSSPDKFYVLPVLWTISLIAYMKINPTQPTQPGTPDMKWIMIGMNLFIGFLSKDWPSGLTLYLLVSNLVGLLQQVMMLRSGKKLQPVQEGV